MTQRKKISDKEFLIELENGGNERGVINGRSFNWDVKQVGERRFSVLRDHISYNIEILDRNDPVQRISVNGTVYEVEAIDAFETLLKKMGMERNAGGTVNELKAPMPGLVLEVGVSVGETVKKGDRLLVLEAMKMENAIKSPVDADVLSVEVKKGDGVEKDQVMIRFG